MFQKSTFFMRIIVILLGAVILLPSILFSPHLITLLREIVKEILLQGEISIGILWGLLYVAFYFALMPFCTAIFQVLRLLNYIDQKETFSEKTVRALKIIKNCAIAILIIYVVGVMPAVCYFSIGAKITRATIMWGALALIPMAIAVFASMLMNLIQEAIDIKSENDLTI